MKEVVSIVISLGTGTIVGIIFSLLKLPLPAPNARAGIFGIIGIFIGSLLVSYFIKK